MNTDGNLADSRRNRCRRRLIALALQDSSMKAETARLLSEVRDRSYWAGEFESFEAYCEQELGMSLRTAQELMKTYNKWVKAGVPEGQIEEIGWSKLALLAKHLTPTNRDKLLADAAASSHAMLKEKYRQGASRGKPRTNRQPDLTLTPSIIAAVTRAGEFTKSDDLQDNLEYVAQRFLDDHPRKRDFSGQSYVQN
jgi:hypothetical protein